MIVNKNPYLEYQELRSSARGHLKELGLQAPKDFEIDHLMSINLDDVASDVVDVFRFDLLTRTGVKLEELMAGGQRNERGPV